MDDVIRLEYQRYSGAHGYTGEQFNQTVMLADALRRRKVDVQELILPDEVHDFLLWRSWRNSYAAAVEFLKKKL